MKRVSGFLVVILITCGSLSSFAQSNTDVLHYAFQVRLSDKSDTISGMAQVTVRFLQPDSTFTFQLGSVNSKGQGMVIDGINNSAGVLLRNYERKNDDVKIILDQARAAGDTQLYYIIYHGVPKDGLIISKNKYGDKTFFADNWPNRAHEWIPCVDNPADKASFEFWVWTPPGFKVVSNGVLTKDRIVNSGQQFTIWREDIPLSTKVMVIGASKFAVKEYDDSPPGIPVSAWVYPQDSSTGVQNYSPAPSILKFYSDYIGPYPYKKLANVQSKTIFGGMENASAIFYFEGSATSKKSVEDLLAHEIAHQWFGDMATEKSFPHLWLSEGFATYMTDIYLEVKYGTDSMKKRLNEERKAVIGFVKHSDRPVVDSVSSYMELLNANSYQKGAWVLHMLCRQMGDSAFHLFIRNYYEKFKGKNADTDDLRAVAEEVAHKDLKPFFKQWLFTPGIPQLNIQWQYNEKNKKLSVTIDQTQKQEAFQFPLQIQLQASSGKSTIQTLNISKRTERFIIPVTEPVTSILIDPNTSLLFDGKIERKKP